MYVLLLELDEGLGFEVHGTMCEIGELHNITSDEIGTHTNDDSPSGQMRQLLPNSGPSYDSSLPKLYWLTHCQAPLYLHASHLHMLTSVAFNSITRWVSKPSTLPKQVLAPDEILRSHQDQYCYCCCHFCCYESIVS